MGTFSCYNDKAVGINGKKIGSFEQFNLILTLLSVMKPKFSDFGKGPGFGDKPLCGFSVISTYFFQSTLLFYILPMIGFAMILFGVMKGGSPSQNNSAYRGANNGYRGANNGTGANQGGSYRKLRR